MIDTNCEYSRKLIESLKEFEWLDLAEIRRAIAFAKHYHADQRRDSGEPFYSHPLAVAEMVAEHCQKTDIIITAILHDTIEDTDATFEIIAEEFSEQIARNVMDLTRIKEGGRKITSAEMLQKLWLEQKCELLLVKLFDRLHNMQTIGHKTVKKIQKTTQETLNAFVFLTIGIEKYELEQKLIETCLVHIPQQRFHTSIVRKCYEESHVLRASMFSK